MTKPSLLRLHTRPPMGAICCRCDEPIDGLHHSAFVHGLNHGGWAHRACLPTWGEPELAQMQTSSSRPSVPPNCPDRPADVVRPVRAELLTPYQSNVFGG